MRTLSLLAILFLIAVTTSLALPPVTHTFTLHAVAYSCTTQPDGVCLGYEGDAPGPTLDVDLGDFVEVTLFNDIATTLPAGAPSYLSTTPVSFHVHGLAVANVYDGVPAHTGTLIPDSTVAPGANLTYLSRAAFAGLWHYHDHVIGADGQEGARRGLYGTVLVRDPGETVPANTVDVHLLEAGPNGRPWYNVTLSNGTFEVDVTGLGNSIWTFTMTSPSGGVQSVEVAPATSDRIVVLAPQVGVYSWTANDLYGLYSYSGSVTLQ